jgi:hypothetical protein
VVILDDVFNADWPEVYLGLALYMEGYLYEQLQVGYAAHVFACVCRSLTKLALRSVDRHGSERMSAVSLEVSSWTAATGCSCIRQTAAEACM